MIKEATQTEIVEDTNRLDANQFMAKYFGDKRLSVMDYKDCCNYNKGFLHLWFFGIGDIIYFNGVVKEVKLIN